MSKSIMNAEVFMDTSEIKSVEKEKQQRPLLLGFYDYTVILTYVGMLFAFMGILFSINEDFKAGVICLMTAGFCDMFDGTIASTKKRTKNQKRFGIQIDSLSDLISFGVLPAVFVYMFSGKSTFSAVVTAIYTLFALIRLSFFNVMEEERQDSTSGKRKEYLGVPVTTVSLLLPFVYILYITNLLSNTIFLLLALLLLGHLFIIAVRIVKPQKTGKIIMLLFGIIEAVGVFML